MSHERRIPVPFVILNKDAARAIFGTEHAVGKTVHTLQYSAVVIGVMENMLGAWVGWDKLTQVMLTAAHSGRSAGALRGSHRAWPARRADDADRAEAFRRRTRIGRSAYVRSHTQIKEKQLSRRQPHGRVPERADRADDFRHGARYRRARELPRERSQEADRHASRGRRASHRHHSLLHAGELVADDRRRGRGHACSRSPSVSG